MIRKFKNRLMKELEIKYQSNKAIMKREQLISIIKTWKTCLDWIIDNLQL